MKSFSDFIEYIGGRSVAMFLICIAAIAGFLLPVFSIPFVICLILGIIGYNLLNMYTSKKTKSIT